MRVLFQPVYMETPHFETELELMADHLEAGDEVFVLACQGELATCFANYTHEAAACRQCQARCAKGLDLVRAHAGPVHVVPYPFAPRPPGPDIPDRFDDFAALTAFRRGETQLGLAAASSLVTRMDGEHELDTIRYAREVATELETASYVYEAVTRVLRDLRPDRMYIFNGRFSTTLPAVNACEQLGVPFVTHERGGSRDRYWVGHNALPQELDYARAEMDAQWAGLPAADAAARGAAFFIDRRNRVEHSWYSFTGGQAVGALPPGLDPAKKNVVIFNSSIEESVGIRSWPRPVLVYEDEVDAVRRLSAAFADDPRYHFYLRVHPHLSGRENTQTRALDTLDGRFANLTVVPPASHVDSYALLEASDVVVTFGSTMGVEACFWDKPSILLGPAYYESLDCAYAPATPEEAVALVRATLAPRPRAGALKYGLWASSAGTPFQRYVPESLTRGRFLGEYVADAKPANPNVRFSVVVPTRNRASFLRRCLESLAAQTYRNFEVLVCDDGSDDSTGEVVREFAGSLDLKYHWAPPWGGPARPRNVGIAHASGDWVCFLDSDDWWAPEKLEACLPYVDDADVVFHDVEVVTEQGLTGEYIGRDVRAPVFVDLVARLNAIPNSAALVRTSILRDVGGVSEDRAIIGAEDFDLWLRLARRTERFHRIPAVLGARFESGSSSLSASPGAGARELRVFERHRDSLSGPDLWRAWCAWKRRRDAAAERASAALEACVDGAQRTRPAPAL